MKSIMEHPSLINHHEALATHKLYQKIKSIDDLKIFMESHVFAVWDFMSLLKRLQKDITCVTLPWKPSAYPKNVVRMINEIVLGEESDKNLNGEACDHFTLYLNAMNDVGANPLRLLNLVEDMSYKRWCTKAEEQFVNFNIDLAINGKTHEVAAAFFFGREKLIPDMFTSILGDLKINFNEDAKKSFPNLCYYLERHIEIDGGEHSHLAHDCLKSLCGDNETKWEEARLAGIKSLMLRRALWDEVELKLLSK